jgi:hypothetical protein
VTSGRYLPLSTRWGSKSSTAPAHFAQPSAMGLDGSPFVVTRKKSNGEKKNR